MVADETVDEGDNDIHTLLATGTKHRSVVGASSDPESNPKEKKRRKRTESDENTSVKKGEKRKRVLVDGELGKVINTSEPLAFFILNALDNNDDKLPQHQDTATLRNAHTERPSILSTDLHQDSSRESCEISNVA